MKKYTFYFVLMLFSNLILAQKISQTYHFNQYQITQLGEYNLISFNNTMPMATPGEPMLPYQSVKLLLPPGNSAGSVKYIFEDKTEIEGNYKLYPKQYVRPISHGTSGNFVFNNKTYNSKQEIGEDLNPRISTQYMNGYSFGFTSFTPVRYSPSSGKLYYYKTVKVILTTEQNIDASKALENISSSKEVQKRVSQFADNPEAADSYPQKLIRNDDYKVLIISSSSYESNFDNLRSIYLYRGMKSEFITVSEISSSMPGSDDQEKIRNYIIQEYTNHAIEHVLLAGDAEIVPYRGFYCEVQSSSVYSDDNIPSDLYYSSLDGNWNTDGDNLWGEYEDGNNDESDLLPEVSVARMPFSNSTELNNMLNKVTSYQENPVTGELDNPLLAGEHLYDAPQTWGADYLELLIGFHDDNGYETTGIPETDPYEEMYARDQSWSASDIIAEINTGHSFVHHVGHSNTNYTMFLYNSDITNVNFNQVNGTTHNYTLVYTHGCICGDFTASDCIAEEMVKIENFAVGFIGNSRYGWFNEGQTEGPSAHIHREFIDALYDQKEDNIGTAHMISKYNTAPWVTAPGQHEEGALRWCFYDCNVLSESTLPIWTADPIDIDVNYNAVITIGAPYNISVYDGGNPTDKIVCTVLQDGIFLGSAETNASGNASIDIDFELAAVGPAELIITGYNCSKESYDITITTGDAAMIVMQDLEFTDGNNNQPDYDEEISFNMTFNNVGQEEATNCVAEISFDDDYITSANTTVDLGTISAEGSIISEGDISVFSDTYVPDQHSVEINLDITSDQDDWSQSFFMTINAPFIEQGQLQITEISGNGNGSFEPGETAEFSFAVANTGHADSPETSVGLSTETSGITIDQENVNIGIISAGEQQYAVFTISANESIQTGDIFELSCVISSGEYGSSSQLNYVIGLLDEDFETGDFTSFEWEFGGNADWLIATDHVNAGSYSASSSLISDNQSTELRIETEVLGNSEISFYKKVSSENSYDYLRFFIDETEKDKWSGDENWSQHTYEVLEGNHTFKWVYDKDSSVSTGSDKAWIDDISFPPMGNISVNINSLQTMDNSVTVFPNPFLDEVRFNYSLNKSAIIKLEICNLNGTVVKIISEKQTKGTNELVWKNNQDLVPGIYIFKLFVGSDVKTGKLIKI